MTDRMPCRISDGPQEPGDVPYTDAATSRRYLDPDAAYDRARQEEVDDLRDALRDTACGLDTTPWLMLRQAGDRP